MSANMKAVDPLTEGTPAISRKEFLETRAKLLAELAKLAKQAPAVDDAEKLEIDSLRYQAFKIQRQIEPLTEERKRLVARHEVLTGVGITTRESDDAKSEHQLFLTRWRAENKAAKSGK